MGIKAIVLIAVTVVWLYEMMLHLVRMRSADNPIPDNVSDVYDEETYRKWRQYHGEKSRLALVTSTVSWIIGMLLLALNAYAAFAGLFPKESPYIQMIAVMLLASLSELPIDRHRLPPDRRALCAGRLDDSCFCRGNDPGRPANLLSVSGAQQSFQ